jgi:hypothetical protein
MQDPIVTNAEKNQECFETSSACDVNPQVSNSYIEERKRNENEKKKKQPMNPQSQPTAIHCRPLQKVKETNSQRRCNPESTTMNHQTNFQNDSGPSNNIPNQSSLLTPAVHGRPGAVRLRCGQRVGWVSAAGSAG